MNVNEMDQNDPLAFAKDRFDIPEGVIYLDGNSLGVLPKSTKARIDDVITREWGTDLIRSWNTNHWMELPARVGDAIAELIGADKGEVVATDSTSVNLFKMAGAALKMNKGRHVLLSETGNFPTDLYIMQGLAELIDGVECRAVETNQLMDALDEDVAALVLTHVNFRSGRMHDMQALCAAAQAKGILTVWDLSHSAGAVDVNLNATGADFAVGCGYKYLNGGPGAPGFLFVAKRHQSTARPPLSGWMGHAAPFEFSDDYEAASGIARHMCGTPPVLGLASLEEGLKTFKGVAISDVRKKSLALCDLFKDQVLTRLDGFGFTLVSPEGGVFRGSQVSLAHDEAYPIVQALIARGVIGDFRAPNIARFGFTPLYLSYADVMKAVDILAEIMQEQAWKSPAFQARAKVT